MRGHPPLAAPAEAAGAPFVGDEVAEFIWATLIPQIHRPALAAKGVGSQFLTPRVRGRPLLLAQAAALLERWSEWLGTRWNDQALGTTLIQAMGLPAPPANIGLSSPGSPSSSRPRRRAREASWRWRPVKRDRVDMLRWRITEGVGVLKSVLPPVRRASAPSARPRRRQVGSRRPLRQRRPLPIPSKRDQPLKEVREGTSEPLADVGVVAQ